jgi:ubiquinone/menaquinone biosynthesis C-methylase UbiE
MRGTSNAELELSRVTRSKAEAIETYDRISGWYDLLEGSWEKKIRDVGLQKLAVQRGEIALEIGPGTGHGILALARSAGESGRVYGIDLSSRMLRLTYARAQKSGCSDRVTLARGDAEHLPLHSQSFDAVFMSFTLELFDTPEIPPVLAECSRVLRRGGRIGVVSLSKAGESRWMRRLYEWGHRRFPRFLDCRPMYVQQALEGAGFQIRDARLMALVGLPVEIVIARKSA